MDEGRINWYCGTCGVKEDDPKNNTLDITPAVYIYLYN